MDKGGSLRKDLTYQLTRGWGREVGYSLPLREHAYPKGGGWEPWCSVLGMEQSSPFQGGLSLL